FSQLLNNLKQKGYQRVRIDGNIYDADDDLTLIKTNKHDISAVIDRLVVSGNQLKKENELKSLRSRVTQSIEEALQLADGLSVVSFIEDPSLNFPEKPKEFTDKLFSEKRA